MENIINISSTPWLIILIASLTCIIFIVFICVCWRTKKFKKSKSFYSLNTSDNGSQLASNMPKMFLGDTQKYFSNNNSVRYSSINYNRNFQDEIVPRESFPFGIFNLFRHIQRNKYKDDENDLTKVFTEDLEASNTDVMIKKFDKSILCMNWNDNSDSTETLTFIDKDDAYSCISGESRATFKSVATHYNRCSSIADTFKSVNSD